MSDHFPKSDESDILILAEGTYPYVTGGVSSWIHNLMVKLPEYKFAIIFLGGKKDDYDKMQYPFPPNLVHFESHYLFEEHKYDPATTVFSDPSHFEKTVELHNQFEKCPFSRQFGLELKNELFSSDTLKLNDFLFHEKAWEYILSEYQKRCPDTSFLDYFWTIRGMHMPIWRVIDAAKNAPKTKVIHSICTGYAGFMGALLHYDRKYPYLLTEHGIYLKERKIDLLAQWVAIGTQSEHIEAQTQQYITDLWIKFFDIFSRITYAAASPIVGLFKEYHDQQIVNGADESKTLIIPNGVPVSELVVLKTEPNQEKPIIGLVGRVVPIKDIKTLIRSMITLIERLPNAECWIIGPMDEDEDYADECIQLVNVLGLSQHIHFKGLQHIPDILPLLDLLVLSSISEGLPLVMLEGFAHGIPCVTTDVGACKTLVYGGTEEDKAIGDAGIVVEVANAKALANAMVTMLTDKAKWQAAQKAAVERTKRYYTEETFLKSYRKLYSEAIASWQG